MPLSQPTMKQKQTFFLLVLLTLPSSFLWGFIVFLNLAFGGEETAIISLRELVISYSLVYIALLVWNEVNKKYFPNLFILSSLALLFTRVVIIGMFLVEFPSWTKVFPFMSAGMLFFLLFFVFVYVLTKIGIFFYNYRTMEDAFVPPYTQILPIPSKKNCLLITAIVVVCLTIRILGINLL